jgi:hypothetical protein
MVVIVSHLIVLPKWMPRCFVWHCHPHRLKLRTQQGRSVETQRYDFGNVDVNAAYNRCTPY